MSLTLQETIDEILARFKEVWDTTDYAANVVWPDVPLAPAIQQMIAGADGVVLQPWVRITIRPNLRRQRSLGNEGNRLFTRNGILFVELFVPTGDGNTESNQLAELIANQFEGITSPYHVWYTETRIAQNGIEGLWSRQTITVEWESEEVK